MNNMPRNPFLPYIENSLETFFSHLLRIVGEKSSQVVSFKEVCRGKGILEKI